MDNKILQEVDDEINRILNRYKCKDLEKVEDVCDVNNLTQILELLQQEFDFLGVNSIYEGEINLSNMKSITDKLVEVVNSSLNLVQLHKSTKHNLTQAMEKNRTFSIDLEFLKKNMDTLKKEVATKERHLKIAKENQILDKVHQSQLKNEVKGVKKQAILLQKENVAERDKYKHFANKVLAEKEQLHENLLKNCGKYISNEGKVVEMIEKYKKNEQKYEKTVNSLQKSNNELLQEIIHLKSEIALLKTT